MDLHCYQNRWPWMTLNGVMAVIWRHLTEIGSFGPTLSKWLEFRPILSATKRSPKTLLFDNIIMIHAEARFSVNFPFTHPVFAARRWTLWLFLSIRQMTLLITLCRVSHIISIPMGYTCTWFRGHLSNSWALVQFVHMLWNRLYSRRTKRVYSRSANWTVASHAS